MVCKIFRKINNDKGVMKEPIVSICLPCYGRVEYVRRTLKSIYEYNSDVSLDDYEIVISDNDPKQNIRTLVSEFNFPNIHYHYTKCEGFMNSYYVLTYATGRFLKLHNSQVIFKKGALAALVQEIRIIKRISPWCFIPMDCCLKDVLSLVKVSMNISRNYLIGHHGAMVLPFGRKILIGLEKYI